MKKELRPLAVTMLLFIAIDLIISACNAEKRCQRQLSKIETKCPGLFQLHDSNTTKTIIREHEHDSNIYLKQPAETYTVQVPCPDYTAPVAQPLNPHAGTLSGVRIKNHILTLICPEDSLKEVIRWLTDSIITINKINQSGMATRTITVPAPPTSWESFCKWWTAITLIIIGCYLGGKYALPLITDLVKPKI